ncbi:Sec-independent protein translocase protein TatB [Frigidibacter sp. MR17.24]|uniref:Sec-independent protein translocase protein TatB n=1 Tax=Frigidibacter sp. MR17.24 TaxID=3127345 RepID=UPI003012F8D9
MLDIGWSELLLIGIVALIVVGPKDLPVMFRQLGRITAKARGMARDFSRAMEDAAKEAGVDDVAKDLRKVTSKKSLGLDALEKAADRFEKWDPKMPRSEPPKAPMGPATQALADKQAAKAAAAKDGVGIGTIGETPASALPETPEPASAPVPGSEAPPAEARKIIATRTRETSGAAAVRGEGGPDDAALSQDGVKEGGAA